ncbi:thioredoxin family protein [Hydrogenivirga caldilitoris]|nr:thioredoxin family protein [Hydrogenivirga caldilitoris]
MKCVEEELYKRKPEKSLRPQDRHVILLTATWCSASQEADAMWRRFKEELGFKYEALDVETPEGRFWVTKFLIKSVPTTIVDRNIAFVGVPKEEEIRELIT